MLPKERPNHTVDLTIGPLTERRRRELARIARQRAALVSDAG